MQDRQAAEILWQAIKRAAVVIIAIGGTMKIAVAAHNKTGAGAFIFRAGACKGVYGTQNRRLRNEKHGMPVGIRPGRGISDNPAIVVDIRRGGHDQAIWIGARIDVIVEIDGACEAVLPEEGAEGIITAARSVTSDLAQIIDTAANVIESHLDF